MELIVEILPSLMKGLQTTLLLFVIVFVVSVPLGLILAILQSYSPKGVSWIIRLYVYIMRGTPLLLQLMFIFFGLPLVGIRFQRFSSAIIAFVLNYAAYFSEIFRGGILSVPDGQFEAIQVLGIGKVRGFIRVILPQVIRTVLPAVGNEVITLFKDTSLVYILGIGELLRSGQIAANTYASLMPFLAVGLIYMAATGILTLLLNKVEKAADY